MKRLIVAIGFIALIVVGIVASLPLFVSSATVRGYIVNQLSELTGRTVMFRGNPQVSFSPFLGIEINHLELSDPLAAEGDDPLLHVSKVQAQLDILPALIGQIKITQFRLVRPMLNMKVYSDGNSNWHFKTGTLRDAYQQTEQTIQGSENTDPVAATLGTFSIVDGIVQFEDTIADRVENITSINGTIRWPTTEDAATLNGAGIWHGENITGSIFASRPMQLMAGGQSQMRWELESTPASVVFVGEANTLSDFFINGSINLKTPSVGRLSDFLAADLSSLDFASATEISGNIEATASSIKVTDAQATVADHTGTGVLSLTRDEVGGMSLDGTLAFDTIDLEGRFAETVENIEALTPPTDSQGIKVDLRISANTIDTGFVELSQVAAAVNATGSIWTFDIGDSQIFGGNLVAKVGKRLEDGEPLILIDLNASNVDVDALFNLVTDNAIGITGTARISASLRSKSLSNFLTVDALNGSLTATIEDGTINGINIPSLLANQPAEENSGFTEADLGGSTPYQSTDFKLFINRGIASLSQASINSENNKIKMIGRVDLRQGNLALRAQEIGEHGTEPERLFIGGTFKAPLVSLRKSGLEVNQPGKNENSNTVSN